MFGLLKRCCPSDFEGVDRIAEIDEVLPTSTPQNVQNNQERRQNYHGRHPSVQQQSIQQQPLPRSIPWAQSPVTSTTSVKQNNYRREVQASFKRFELKQQQIQSGGVSSSDKPPQRKIRHGYRVSDLEDLPKQDPQPSTVCETNQLRKSYIGKGSSKLQIVWKKNQILGCGAFSTVFLGWSVTHDGPIAVKEIPYRSCWNNLAKNDTQRILIQSSENEVNALRSLSHTNIVKYLGCERDLSDEVVRVFMEYVGDCTLLNLVRKQNLGFLEEMSVSGYTVQILQGLSYLHSQFIIHRDIKGSNILWSERDDVLKLADFGAATQLAQYLTSESGSGHLYGTPQYMSPEAMRGERVSFASDIWAVGCVVLEMLSGKSPWQRDFSNRFIAVNLLSQKKSGPPIPDNLSCNCKNFLAQCFRMNPRDRPTAKQLLSHPFLMATQDVELSQPQDDCSQLQARSLSAPDITKVSEESEIIYRTTYSSVVINQILQHNNDQQAEITTEQQECDELEEQIANNIYTSLIKMNPIRSYCSDEFCDSAFNSERTDYTHVKPSLFLPQRYLQHTESVEEYNMSSLDLRELLHDEGQQLTTQLQEFRRSVASKSESSTVLYGSVQCSPNVSPQVSLRTNKRTQSASLFGVNVSTDYSSAHSQINENNYNYQGLTEIFQMGDKDRRPPLQDAMQVLNKTEEINAKLLIMGKDAVLNRVEEINEKLNTVGNNTGYQEVVKK